MQAIILAGGFGTRLGGVLNGTPKPMAPVAGRPFLAWLFEYMEAQGVTDVLLCLHYQHASIRDYFGDHFGVLSLRYIIEGAPLGTGGALKQAMALLQPKEPVFALNGDSLVMLDYCDMLEYHRQKKRPLTMAVHEVKNRNRYSALSMEESSVTQYEWIGKEEPGMISAGLYVLSPELFISPELPETFSFEREFLAPNVPLLRPAGYNGVNYFIDIGTPADYARAEGDIPHLLGVRHAA